MVILELGYVDYKKYEMIIISYEFEQKSLLQLHSVYVVHHFKFYGYEDLCYIKENLINNPNIVKAAKISFHLI